MQYTADSWDNVAPTKATATFSAADLLAKGPGNHWSIVQLTDGAPADIKGVTASLVSPTGFVSARNAVRLGQGRRARRRALDWQVAATGVWFFQNPLCPLPQQWTIRWSFPNGQSCGAAFTVTA